MRQRPLSSPVLSSWPLPSFSSHVVLSRTYSLPSFLPLVWKSLNSFLGPKWAARDENLKRKKEKIIAWGFWENSEDMNSSAQDWLWSGPGVETAPWQKQRWKAWGGSSSGIGLVSGNKGRFRGLRSDCRLCPPQSQRYHFSHNKLLIFVELKNMCRNPLKDSVKYFFLNF